MVSLVACGDHTNRQAGSTPFETAIARTLTARLAIPVSATCTVTLGIPAACEARLFDGTRLPIAITSAGTEWAWRVAGLVVDTVPVAAYVDARLAELAVAQRASCGARFLVVAPGDRIGCRLSGGGIAFVRVAGDGTASLELDLDAASAAARGEPVTPARDRELTAISLALDGVEGESGGEE